VKTIWKNYLRHEDIDDHQVESERSQNAQSGFSAIGDRDPKVVPLKTGLDRRTDLRIVRDRRDPAHNGPQPSATRWTNACIDRVNRRESSPPSIFWLSCKEYPPETGIGTFCNPLTCNVLSGNIGGPQHAWPTRRRASFKMTATRAGFRVALSDPPPRTQRPLNHLLQALSTNDFGALQPHMQPIELVREAVLVEAGAPLTHVYLPETGIVSIVIRLSEGQRIEMAMTGRDSMIGASAAFGEAVSLSEASVLLPGTAFLLDVANFRAVADRSAALRALLARHEQALLAQVQQSAACNASHSVEARLSLWLLRAHELCDDRTLPLTQELLAQMIGVQRNAVSLVAHTLQQAGIISYSRGHIEINDLEGLAQASCECYRVVNAQRDRLLNTANSRSNRRD
jgi:CRP-like cAMP-binding protein